MSKPFDLFAEFAKFGAQREISLRDPNLVSAFVMHTKKEVDHAIADSTLVHGQRVEAMFEAMVVSLGDYCLLKPEDFGRVHPDKQERRLLTRCYREKLESYAAATGGELKLAVFWARWAIWTLISPKELIDENGDLTLNMQNALKANELGKLGDKSIGTRPPLRFRVVADPEKTTPVAADGTVNFMIGDVKFFCDENEILDPVEWNVAFALMLYGEWEEKEPKVEIVGNTLKFIEFRWEPEVRINEGFEIIGTLSTMFAKYYAENTVNEHEVVQIHAPPLPGWFEPLDSWEFENKALRLWILIQQPNYD